MNLTRLWIILALLFLAAVSTYSMDLLDEDDDDDEDDDKEEPAFCGGVTEDLTTVQTPPPGGKFPDADTTTYKPFRFLYIVLGEWTENEKKLLDQTFDAINEKLGRIIRGPRLKEIRVRRSLRETKTSCASPKCDARIPREYGLPCIDETGSIIKDGSEVYTEEVQAYNKEQYSVVLFAWPSKVENQTHLNCRDTIGKTKRTPPIAFAKVCQRGDRNRPTHGMFVFCAKPENISKDNLYSTILHESLHVVIKTLDGSDFPSNPLVQQGETNATILSQSAEGKTWQWVTRNWELDESLHNQTEVQIPVSMTPSVLRYVTEHFKCDSVEGAELAVVAGDYDYSHWSNRLFPDEMMSPVYTPGSRLSKLTLGFIHDSSWYDVNMSLAEPLVVSRPHKNGCDVAKKSCTRLLSVRSPKPDEVLRVRPFCDTKFRVITSLCSSDNIIRLDCVSTLSVATNGCTVLRHADISKSSYTDTSCPLSRDIPRFLDEKGLRVGPGTMCITFVETNWTSPRRHKRLVPACVAYECGERKLILRFQRVNKTSCNITINAGIDDYKIIKDPFPAGDECAQFLPSIKFIAPDVGVMCSGGGEHSVPYTGTYSVTPNGVQSYRLLWRWVTLSALLIKHSG